MFWFHTRRGIFWLTELLSASKEGLCSIEVGSLCVLYRQCKQVGKCALSVITLARSSEFDLCEWRQCRQCYLGSVTFVWAGYRAWWWRNYMDPLIGCSAGWGFPLLGFPTQSLTFARTHLLLHVRCPLSLFDLNENLNVSIDFEWQLQKYKPRRKE
jgi:hypothetical protein